MIRKPEAASSKYPMIKIDIECAQECEVTHGYSQTAAKRVRRVRCKRANQGLLRSAFGDRGRICSNSRPKRKHADRLTPASTT